MSSGSARPVGEVLRLRNFVMIENIRRAQDPAWLERQQVMARLGRLFLKNEEPSRMAAVRGIVGAPDLALREEKAEHRHIRRLSREGVALFLTAVEYRPGRSDEPVAGVRKHLFVHTLA